MSAMFSSIVVDPFVFYAVITGVLLAMGIVLFLLIKSKRNKQDYITLEPITIKDNDNDDIFKMFDTKNSILDINIKSNLDKDKNDVKPQEEVIDIVDAQPELNTIISSIEKDLINEKKTVIANFEIDQEQEAIISYQELLKKKEALLSNNKYDDEVVEKIDIEPITEKPIISEVSSKTEEAVKKFKNSEFISPIFGRVDNQVEYPNVRNDFTTIDKEFEKEVNVKPLNNEINKNEDFLSSLKNFRKNLE